MIVSFRTVASILLGWFLLAGQASPVAAQGTRADYERANALQKQARGGLVRATVRPNWFAGNDRFWYRNDLAGGVKEYLVVDATTGNRRPAFDQARLAKSLGEGAETLVDADRLDLTNFEPADDGRSIRFDYAGKPLRCDLETYQIDEAGPATTRSAPTMPADPIRAGGSETEVEFVNKTAGPVELFWVQSADDRVSYGKLASGDSRKQHTFGGHVWMAVDKDGKPVGRFVAADTPARFEIDGKGGATTPPLTRGSRDGGPGRRNNRGGRSPDDRFEAVIRDHNLAIRNVMTEEETRLSDDGTDDDPYRPIFFWSPDSAKLIAIRERPAEEHKVTMVESSPRDQVQPKVHTQNYLKPGDRIAQPRPRLFDIANKRPIPVDDALFANPWALTEYRWAPDSSGFTFLYNQRGHQALRLIEIDAVDGSTRAIVDEQSPTFLDYSNKTFLRILEPTSEAIWMSERSGWNHLYLIDMQTGEVKNPITSGPWLVRRVDRVDPKARQIWFRAGGIVPGQDPYYVHFARVNFDGSGLTLLTEGDGTHDIQISPDNRFLVDTYSRVDQPPVTELRRTSDGQKVCDLERADTSTLMASGSRFPERFVAKARDGKTDIFGVIWRPSNFDTSKSYPVIEDIYAGPQGAFVPKAFSAGITVNTLAELGFIVVKIDGMGTNWRSKAFHDVCWKNLKDAGFPDRIAWMKAAAAKFPQMDLERVGLYGGSAGGQNALGGLLFHGDFYKVGAADCGCHDNRMDKVWWNEAWMGHPIGPEYADNSNVTHAKNLTGKLFLTVGELDKNVDPASTMQVVNALIRADKDFELIVFPGADHGAGGSPYGDRRRKDFFVRHLLGVEPRSH